MKTLTTYLSPILIGIGAFFLLMSIVAFVMGLEGWSGEDLWESALNSCGLIVLGDYIKIKYQ